MPRPEAREFAGDVKLYVFIGKAAANLYRDSSLDIRGIANKVHAMLDAYIMAHGIDPKIPPIEILDPNFAAEVARKKSDRTKAAEMENALRHHISMSFDRDPAKFKTLSEKLEAILVAHHEDWRTLTEQLQRLIDDATAATSRTSVHHGLDPRTEGPLFGLLRMRLGSDDHNAEIAELAANIVSQIKKDAAVQSYWDNAVAQEAARKEIVQLLDNVNLFPFTDLDAIAADCMGVARANRGAFGP